MGMQTKSESKGTSYDLGCKCGKDYGRGRIRLKMASGFYSSMKVYGAPGGYCELFPLRLGRRVRASRTWAPVHASPSLKQYRILDQWSFSSYSYFCNYST